MGTADLTISKRSGFATMQRIELRGPTHLKSSSSGMDCDVIVIFLALAITSATNVAGSPSLGVILGVAHTNETLNVARPMMKKERKTYPGGVWEERRGRGGVLVLGHP